MAKKKKQKKKQKQNFKLLLWDLRLKAYANEIESNNWKSDSWLKEQFQNIADENDEFNSPEGYFIPDLINRKLKYIIECDGSIHRHKHVKIKDFSKDNYFFNIGYKVFRVKSGDLKEMNKIKDFILLLKSDKKIKTIIRKKPPIP